MQGQRWLLRNRTHASSSGTASQRTPPRYCPQPSASKIVGPEVCKETTCHQLRAPAVSPWGRARVSCIRFRQNDLALTRSDWNRKALLLERSTSKDHILRAVNSLPDNSVLGRARGELYPVETDVRLCDELRTGQEVEVDMENDVLTVLDSGTQYNLKPLGEVRLRHPCMSIILCVWRLTSRVGGCPVGCHAQNVITPLDDTGIGI